MLRHIVMFRLKNQTDKAKNLEKLKKELDELENKIPEVISLETGINMNPKSSAYDLVLITDFENEDVLDRYRSHTEHQKVLEFIAEINEETAVVDYYL